MDEFFALESAPPASVMNELELRGGAFPSPDELTDAALPSMLWRMLRSLACMRTFVRNTDHLTDRQLYTRLWRDTLRDESFVATPRGLHGGFFLDLVGSGSDDDFEIYARDYMSTTMRRFNAKQGIKLPRNQRPPFKRDRFLPKCGSNTEGCFSACGRTPTPPRTVLDEALAIRAAICFVREAGRKGHADPGILRSASGTGVLFFRVTGSGSGSLYGTDVYTSDSEPGAPGSAPA